MEQIKPCPFCGCIPEANGDVVTHWMPLLEPPKQ